VAPLFVKFIFKFLYFEQKLIINYFGEVDSFLCLYTRINVVISFLTLHILGLNYSISLCKDAIRMKLKILFYLSMVSCMLISCASNYCLRALDLGPKTIEYYNGEMYQVSKGNNSIVAITLKKQDNKHMEFLIGIINTGSNSFVVSTNIVSANYYIQQKRYNLHIYSDAEWLRKLRKQQIAAAIATGISQGLEASSAGWTNTNTTASIYGSDGSNTFVYGNSTTYDYSKSAAVRRQHQIERDEINRTFQNDMYNISEKLLRANTLHPGQNVSGVVMAKYVNCDRYDISVNCNSEIHKFSFNISKGDCDRSDYIPDSTNDIFAEYIKKAEEYISLSNYLNAIDQLNIAIKIQPNNVDAYVLRARLHLTVRNYSSAYLDFSKAINLLEKNDVELLNGRGWSGLWLSKWEESRIDFEHAIGISDTTAISYFNMCDYYWAAKRDKDSALIFLEKGCQRTNDMFYFNALYDMNQDGYFLTGLNDTPEFKTILEKYITKINLK
jgi:tetratricopeptide (TPR) repeat protein